MYKQSIATFEGHGDNTRRNRADTYIFWARNERSLGDHDESINLIEKVKVEARNIIDQGKKNDMLGYINSVEHAVLAPPGASITAKK